MRAMPKPPKATKKARPTRDEFELEEIASQLTDALESKNEIILTVWKRGNIQGVVTKMDGNTKIIHVKEKFNDTHYIPFMDILRVSHFND